MLNCTRGACGCSKSKSKDLSSSKSSSTGTSMSEEGGGGGSHLEVSKQNGVGAFLAALSPRNFLKGLRKSDIHSMPKGERMMKAALLIQQWYRRYLARMEIRRRYTWTIFQSIEYQGEQDQMKLYNFFNALLTHIPTAPTSNVLPGKEVTKSSKNDSNETKVEPDSPTHIPTYDLLDSSYKGLHITFPMTKKDLENLIDSFRKKKPHRLHPKYVAGILKQAALQLKKLPNLNPASTTISKQITIIGDLHGKLDDLLIVFHKNGLPSAENPYIFNGDFVDRGKKGIEVFLLLLSCLLVFPDGVFLNRGNHEDHVMNTRYGFIREVKLKYKENAEKLLKLIETVYRWLPVGTVINNKVLVVHGGISDSTDIEWLKKIDRHKYVSLLRPPVIDGVPVSSENIDKQEWKQVFDILWSDPQRSDGCIPNTLRGAGTYFGPDVTNKFLEKHNFSFIVRSHECKLGGYELVHERKVITIFSASNYYESGSNKGAYLKLVGVDLQQHFVQYTSCSKVSASNLTFRQKVGLIESSAIKELRSIINYHKPKLVKEFEALDPRKSGCITISNWCKVVEDVTGLALPWRMLRDKLVHLGQDSSTVKYMTTFQEVPSKNEQADATTVVETLYRNKSSLEAIFRIIDKDNSGYITVDEFREACLLIGEHLDKPQEEALDICKSMDLNKDGRVDLNEFLETFRLVDNEMATSSQEGGGSDEEDI